MDRTAIGQSKDNRIDLGYGRGNNKFHSPRQAMGTYPYIEDGGGSLDDPPVLSDEEVDVFLRKTLADYYPIDLDGYYDPFYFAAGNTKLSEVSGTSLVPFPGMYKSRTNVGSGFNVLPAISPGNDYKTGTTYSYVPEDDISLEEYQSGESPAILKLRKLIQRILQTP